MKKNDSQNTIYLVSYSKLPKNISITNQMEVVGVGLFVNYETGNIDDMICTLLADEVNEFLKKMIVGKNLNTGDVKQIIKEIEYRFHGMSQKAICSALSQVYERYQTWRSNNLLKN